MKTFRIIPILGRKTDVPPDDPSMLQMVGEGLALSHDAGGKNYDLKRKRNACTKVQGKTQRSNTANASATQCQGLFQLYDGTNRNYFYFDNGVVYYYDSSWDPVALSDTYLNYDNQTGSFTAGNTIIGGTSGATATIVFVYDGGSSDGRLYLTSVVGTFQNNEVIYEATYGSDLLSGEGDMEDTTDFDDNYGSPTTNERSDEQAHGGTYSRKLVADSSGDGTRSEFITTTADSFYIVDGWVYVSALTATEIRILASRTDTWGLEGYESTTTTGSWVNLSFVFQASHTSTAIGTYMQGAGAATWYVDDITFKQITNAALANGTVGTTTFANDSQDLYSAIRVGAYMVFTDRAENYPMKWTHGDAVLTSLAASGTRYKFRYLESFQRRVVGAYSDQTNGNIDVRWSSAWPATAITALSFSSSNQLYIPNDDPITGIKVLGREHCFIFCEDSIQQLVYYPDYSSPFRCYTVVPYQGCTNHHSIVGREGTLSFYNRNYGFCEYHGGTEVIPISDDISYDLTGINTAYHSVIVGVHHPFQRKILWAVPLGGQSECDHIVAYSYDTKQWEIMDRSARYLDMWNVFSSVTWNDLITALGGTGATWEAAGTSRWSDYTSSNDFLIYGGTDGHFYTHAGESLNGANINGYREEPVLWFGDRQKFKTLLEVWFDLGLSAGISIDVYHRSGNTVGELINKPWTSLGSVSCDDPYNAELKVNQHARLHQIKWGTDLLDETFEINGIVFKYNEGSIR